MDNAAQEDNTPITRRRWLNVTHSEQMVLIANVLIAYAHGRERGETNIGSSVTEQTERPGQA